MRARADGGAPAGRNRPDPGRDREVQRENPPDPRLARCGTLPPPAQPMIPATPFSEAPIFGSPRSKGRARSESVGGWHGPPSQSGEAVPLFRPGLIRRGSRSPHRRARVRRRSAGQCSDPEFSSGQRDAPTGSRVPANPVVTRSLAYPCPLCGAACWGGRIKAERPSTEAQRQLARWFLQAARHVVPPRLRQPPPARGPPRSGLRPVIPDTRRRLGNRRAHVVACSVDTGSGVAPQQGGRPWSPSDSGSRSLQGWRWWR